MDPISLEFVVILNFFSLKLRLVSGESMAISDLPVDIVFQILLWLPVMSLLRFKSVCESWRVLIENPRFIAQHMNHHSRISGLLAKRRPTMYGEDSIFLLPGENSEATAQILDLPPYIKADSQLDLVSYCRGIICLYENKYDNLSLWNPATREFRVLPLLPVACPPGFHPHFTNIIYGLGFDVKTNDFKVVRIIIFFGESYTTLKEQVEVYNLSSNSWRIIHPAYPPNYHLFICKTDSKVELNGMYCWLVRHDNSFFDVVIVLFDFMNEVFQTMALPDGCHEKCSKHLAVLNNEPKIGLMFNVGDSHNRAFEFWVLNEFGVKESWARLYTLRPLSNYTRPLGFSNNVEFVLLKTNGQLSLRNPITQEIKNLDMPWEESEATSLEALVYQESLATLHPSTVKLNCSSQ